MAQPSCFVCSSEQLRLAFRAKEWTYLACPKCGHAQLDPLPSAEAMRPFYEETYFVNSQTGGYASYLADEPLHRLNARDRLARMQRAGATTGRLLDVGCAAGFFLDEARQQGWEAQGLDCSRWARQVATDKFGATTWETWAELLASPAEPFDVVTMFQVLEHFPDPRSARCRGPTDATRGLLVVETWNRESLIARLSGRFWQQITPPSVVHLFSNRSLRRLVESFGFKHVQIRRSGKLVSAEFAGNLLYRKHPRLLAPLHWLTSRTWAHHLSVRYALGDLVTLTASR